MKTGSAKAVRCAVYTRVSTDQKLEQDFNSLDAQYDASQAYVRSQAHAGWTLLRGKYDDGGFSGGDTDRPALQRLLEDVRAGKIDVIVVYKVDRLTRSLSDFAKLVELFDKHNVSFVSVTQQFNTTTSMGRLTLNVLLSFAQFEREVTSERIRDKISASKRKGLWVGGMVPLGYDTKGRKITVNEAEAERVRTIFRSYLKLGSLNLLMAELRKQGIVSKIRKLRTGDKVGGIPLTRGPLAHLLRNRFYIGEVHFTGEVLQGEQPTILDRDLFEAVQVKLSEQATNHITTRIQSRALLTGRIFDDRGNRMSPSHARKGNTKYRYYLSSALFNGTADCAGSVRRVPATDIEALVVKSVREHLKPAQPIDDRSLIETHVARVEVRPTQLIIRLAQHERSDRKPSAENCLRIAWRKAPATRHREILLPEGTLQQNARPIRSETRATLVASIARGRRWLDELATNGIATAETIAKREGCSIRKVNMTISLAFLAPDLVKAAIAGRLPHDGWVTQQQGTVDIDTVKANKAAVAVAQANVAAQENQLKVLHQNRDYASVIAPFDGVITKRNVDVGSLVQGNATSGTFMFTIMQSDVMRVWVYVPQDSAFGLAPGVDAVVGVPEIPGSTFSGKVTRIAKALETNTRTLLTEIDISNPDAALQPGVYCIVELNIPVKTPSFIVPADATIFNKNGLQVAVVEAGTVHIRKVLVTRDLGTQVEVTDGVKQGDQVVMNPPVTLVEGSKVRARAEVAAPRT